MKPFTYDPNNCGMFANNDETFPLWYRLFGYDGTDAIFIIHQSQMFRDAPDFIIYEGKKYSRGPLEIVPVEYQRFYSGMRRYHFVEDVVSKS